MQEYERIGPRGTLTAAVFLHRPRHSTQQDVANVSARQHTLERAVRCSGFAFAPGVTVRTNPVGKFLEEKKRCECVCEREKKRNSKREPFKQKMWKLSDHFPCK